MKLTRILILLLVVGIFSCEMEYKENPNEPTKTTPNTVFNHTVKATMDDLNALFFGGGRFSQVTVQYWQQAEYGDEDRYGYRESMRNYWEQFYYDLKNFKQVIDINTNPETKEQASAYGDNAAQIACSRIMMTYLFNEMTNVWGPIPYWSFGKKDNQDFQALKLADNPDLNQPKYVKEETIHEDMLSELKAAYDQLEGAQGFTSGDPIYGGNTAKWQKFANSLRLRIAVKIKDAMPQTAQTHIDDVLNNSGDYIKSNADNAVFVYGTADKNSAPYYYGVNVDKRRDFAMSNTLVTLMQGNNIMEIDRTIVKENPFDSIQDPRLPIYAKEKFEYEEKDTTRSDLSLYGGMPIVKNSDIAEEINWMSYPGRAIDDKPDYPEVLMEYAEVEFLLSELSQEGGKWDNAHYKDAVSANMNRWNSVDETYDISNIDNFVENELPDISSMTEADRKEHVMTQKYIAMYMQANLTFQEYRRTGQPEFLIKPGDVYGVYDAEEDTVYGNPITDENFKFEAIPDVNDLPYRMKYPAYETTLNEENNAEAIGWLSNGNVQNSPLIWDDAAN